MSNLAISKLSLSHFRSYKHATIQIDHRPVAIYGANGVGKTNILEAISLLSPGRGLRRAQTHEFSRHPENLGWKISSVLKNLDQTHELETFYSDGGSRNVLINNKSAPQIALSRIARVIWLVPMMDRLWLEGAEGRRRFLDRLAMSFFPAHADNSLAYMRAMRERNKMLKDGIRDPAWYDAVEIQMAQAGSEIEKNRLATIKRITAAQTHIQAQFPTADLSLISGDGNPIFNTQNDLLYALKESRSRDMNAGRSLVGPHRDDLLAIYTAKNTNAKLCSTGEQKALLISLILSNARALAQDFGAAPIILLDEISAHLDADRRAALYDEICTLGAQAWMTGTGVELFDSLGDRVNYIEVSEENNYSVITQL